MKKFLVLLALLPLLAAGAGQESISIGARSQPIHYVVSGSANCWTSATSPLTSGAIDTTGSKLIVVVVTSNPALTSLTDSKSNGAPSSAGSMGTNPYLNMYYWSNPTVGTGHTFTAASTGTPVIAMCVYPVSGGAGVFDTGIVSQATNVGTTCSAGSITPASGSRIIFAATSSSNSNGTNSTINSSYTIPAQAPGSSGVNYPTAGAYLTQITGTATNPQWTATASGSNQCMIASFH